MVYQISYKLVVLRLRLVITIVVLLHVRALIVIVMRGRRSAVAVLLLIILMELINDFSNAEESIDGEGPYQHYAAGLQNDDEDHYVGAEIPGGHEGRAAHEATDIT